VLLEIKLNFTSSYMGKQLYLLTRSVPDESIP
jgi:hypothetical protein